MNFWEAAKQLAKEIDEDNAKQCPVCKERRKQQAERMRRYRERQKIAKHIEEKRK